MTKTVFAWFAAMTALLAPAGVAQAGDVLFVSDANTDSNIPGVLSGDGHTVTVVTSDYSAGANPTLTGSIAGYDAVVWSATGSGGGGTHDAATFTALSAYVAGGGNVFVTGYDSVASPTDANLITFLGGGSSTDVPGAAGVVIGAANELTTGVVDIRGVTPAGGSSDRDALRTLAGDTVGVVPTGASTTEFQWTLRTPGASSGVIAYVSNGQSGTTGHPSWTTTTAGGAGAYNAALRNFAHHTSTADILFVSDVNSDNNIPTALAADGHRVTVVTNDYVSGSQTNPTLTGDLSAYDAVYWSAVGGGSGSTHAAATFTALSAYVSGGGLVMVVGYDSVASPTDTNLIAFLGGAGSRDVPPAVGACTTAANEITTGVVDIRGVTPTGANSDRDALNGLSAGTTGVCASSGSSTEFQVTLRTLGGGRAAYVGNGASGTTSAHASWTNTTAGGAGAYNAMLRNFARWAAGASLDTTLPNGAVCMASGDCGSGFCVDGVCCDSVCGGGATDDCQACAVAAGATSNGTCGALSAAAAAAVTCRPSADACDAAETCVAGSTACPADGLLAAGTVCRAAADLCDASEACTGASAACPADGLLAGGTECRAASGPCDLAEACTGASAACPGDGFVMAGTECRAVAGVCDVAEACTGTGAACPADGFVMAGTECRPAATVCDLIEACSGAAAACPGDMFVPDGMTCDDGLACTAGNTCMTGLCMGAGVDCDDGDACTADSCTEPGGCAHAPIADCCTMDLDCDDGDPCTTDSCGMSDTCSNSPIAGCGVDSGVLPDGGADDAGEDGGIGPDGAIGTDSGVGADSGADGGGRARGDSGCACRVATAPTGMPTEGGLVFAGVVAILAWRRRRRG